MPTFTLVGALLIVVVTAPVMWVVRKAKKRDQKQIKEMDRTTKN